MKDVDTRKMILVLGMMAFWCNGDNYAAAHLQRLAPLASPGLRAEPAGAPNSLEVDRG